MQQKHGFVHNTHDHVCLDCLALLLLQAPKALAELCIRALQQHPHSPTQFLVNKCMEEMLDHCGHTHGIDELGRRVCAAMLQQLQQAGFLQHLPSMMALAAQDLTDVANPAQTPSFDSNSSSGSSSGSNSGDGSTRSSGRSSTVGPPPNSAAGDNLSRLSKLWFIEPVLDNANCVLSMCNALMLLMSPIGAGVGGLGAAACLQPAPAARQLILTAYQTLHKLQMQLNPDGTPSHLCLTALSFRASGCALHASCIGR
jgi:hypothetical protein